MSFPVYTGGVGQAAYANTSTIVVSLAAGEPSEQASIEQNTGNGGDNSNVPTQESNPWNVPGGFLFEGSPTTNTETHTSLYASAVPWIRQYTAYSP
jgi:hypothetical protein